MDRLLLMTATVTIAAVNNNLSIMHCGISVKRISNDVSTFIQRKTSIPDFLSQTTRIWALLSPSPWPDDYIGRRAVRRRRRAAAADILLTPPPPIITDRRAAAAAADRMSASRRHRFREVFTSRCTPAICC